MYTIIEHAASGSRPSARKMHNSACPAALAAGPTSRARCTQLLVQKRGDTDHAGSMDAATYAAATRRGGCSRMSVTPWQPTNARARRCAHIREKDHAARARSARTHVCGIHYYYFFLFAVRTHTMETVVEPPICGGAALGTLAHRQVPSFFAETHRTIGGIGRTLRWRFASTAHTDSAGVEVILTNLASDVAFWHAFDGVSSVAAHTSPIECDDDEYGVCTSMSVHDARNVMQVVSLLALSNPAMRYIILDATREHHFELGIERFDRSKWNFYNQTDTTAAPKQSWHKWTLSWIPTSWSHLPFTWSRLAMNLDDLCIDRAPAPLCYHLVESRLQRLDAEIRKRRIARDARPEAGTTASDVGGRRSLRSSVADPTVVLMARRRALARRRSGKRHVTSSLSPEQTRELLLAFSIVRYECDASVDYRAAVQILQFYIMYGFTARVVGPYRQDAQHVGFGRRPRRFRNLRQYDVAQLDVGVLSRMYQSNGDLHGCGAPRCAKRATTARNDHKYMARLRASQSRFVPLDPVSWVGSGIDADHSEEASKGP